MKRLTLPGSKSITNRDFILAALSSGKTVLKGILLSDDTNYMMKALSDIGINIRLEGDTVIIEGGVEKLKGNNKELYLGQSGTCMRFLTALIVLNKVGTITLTGEERLMQRPLGDLLDALQQLGVKFESNGDLAPIKVYPSNIISNKLKINGTFSSQFFTALMHIAPLLKNGLEIEVIGDLVSKPYIDITINEMLKFGVSVQNIAYQKFVIKHGDYKVMELIVEGDASALSYIACYIALHGGEIKIENIGSNSKQGDYKFLDILKIFGLEYISNGETTILKSNGIKNIDLSKYRDYFIDFENMPDVSMSFMIMSIFLPGITTITGLQTLNLKECLRIDVMRNELRKLGVEVESDEKSIKIGGIKVETYAKFEISQKQEVRGRKNFSTGAYGSVSDLENIFSDEEIRSFSEISVEMFCQNIFMGNINIETYNDHRIAMCFGILNTYIGNLNILNPECVAKTYPNFWKDLEMLRK